MIEIRGNGWMIRREANTDIEVMNILCELYSVNRCGSFVLDPEHSTKDITAFRFIKKDYSSLMAENDN